MGYILTEMSFIIVSIHIFKLKIIDNFTYNDYRFFMRTDKKIIQQLLNWFCTIDRALRSNLPVIYLPPLVNKW